jgi:2-polyprenyl-3-methyl-5-hydroxy-6-metoxy-1,4-benzoquinol methylase
MPKNATVLEEVLTDRQARELDYHREYAKQKVSLLTKPFSYEVSEAQKRRWWNGYWTMYSVLRQLPLAGKKVLVVGCGLGDDALRLAKLGAHVSAFDLSPESLAIASALALREGLDIDFKQMPAERLEYESNVFDFVLACDILHHVEIPQAMAELVRVAKPHATFVINELYSHSFTDKIRRSNFVERKLYPALQSFIYRNTKPYITADERKLTEHDMKEVLRPFARVTTKKYFYLFATRLFPDNLKLLSQIDRLLLLLLHPFGSWLAARILLTGVIRK